MNFIKQLLMPIKIQEPIKIPDWYFIKNNFYLNTEQNHIEYIVKVPKQVPKLYILYRHLLLY